VGAVVLVALSAVLASAYGGSPREIADALSMTATKVEARWSRLAGLGQAGPTAPMEGATDPRAAPERVPADSDRPLEAPTRSVDPSALAPGAPVPLDAAAEPLRLAPARLSLPSDPGASVFVDGVYVGTTPLLDLAVPPGQHLVRVEQPDRLPYTLSVTVDPGQDLSLTGIAPDRREP
jgi:hypothetical protein